jgi:hypothetical protein
MYKEAVMFFLKELSQTLSEGSEKKLQSVKPVTFVRRMRCSHCAYDGQILFSMVAMLRAGAECIILTVPLHTLCSLRRQDK